MYNLKLTGLQGVPTIFFDVSTGVCEITGKAYQERSMDYLEQLVKHLERYIDQVGGKITVNIRLTYFNSGSSKRILHLLDILKAYEKNNGVVTVNWYYDEEDLDMEELANDLSHISKLKVNLITDPQMGLE